MRFGPQTLQQKSSAERLSSSDIQCCKSWYPFVGAVLYRIRSLLVGDVPCDLRVCTYKHNYKAIEFEKLHA